MKGHLIHGNIYRIYSNIVQVLWAVFCTKQYWVTRYTDNSFEVKNHKFTLTSYTGHRLIFSGGINIHVRIQWLHYTQSQFIHEYIWHLISSLASSYILFINLQLVNFVWRLHCIRIASSQKTTGHTFRKKTVFL